MNNNQKYSELKRKFSLSINKNNAQISELDVKIKNISNEFGKLDALISDKIKEKNNLNSKLIEKKNDNSLFCEILNQLENNIDAHHNNNIVIQGRLNGLINSSKTILNNFEM